MKILHTSDWHIGKIVNNYSMIEDQIIILKQLENFILNNDIDVLIIAGDLYDRPIPSVESIVIVNNFFCNIIKYSNTYIIAIAGNHDSPDRLSHLNFIMESKGLYIIGNISKDIKPIKIIKDKLIVNFYPIPYFSVLKGKNILENQNIKTFNDSFKQYIKYISPNINHSEINISIAHGFFSNLKGEKSQTIFSESEISLGGIDIIDASYLNIFDYSTLGHLHSSQKVVEKKSAYSGSILKYSQSEISQKKSFTIIDIIDKNNLNISKIPFIPKRDMILISEDFYNINFEEHYSEDYVFVHITNTENIIEPINKLKTIFPNIMGVKFINKQISTNINSIQKDAIINKTVPQIFKTFYKTIAKDDLTKDQIDIINNII